MEIPLLRDILLILALAVAVVLAGRRVRMPVLVGLLLTGAVAGPHAFGLVRDVRQVETLAEIGVVLLLFTIGIEFSFERLFRLGRVVALGGPLQCMATATVGVALARLAGRPWTESVFLGLLLSLSSTAIVLHVLRDRLELDSMHGRTALGILIAQDLALVPMMLAAPFLAGRLHGTGGALLGRSVVSITILSLLGLSARRLVPGLLRRLAGVRGREPFLLGVILIGLAIAWLSSRAGLSLALGAFLAGLILSESDYGQQALADLLPFRDVFTSFFFVSIGMLLDLRALAASPVRIFLLTAGVLAIKGLVASAVAVALRVPLRSAVLTGIALSQVGEFSFVLADRGLELQILSPETFQQFVAVSVLTMAVAPLAVALSPAVAAWAARLPWPKALHTGQELFSEGAERKLEDHLVIVGFGVNGRNLARAARKAGIPYLVLEADAEAVRSGKAAGEPIYYGDATRAAVLEHAGVGRARVLVVAISDPTATRSLITAARRLDPTVHLIARTRYVQEMAALRDVGADEVIPEELETSVEIFTRVLRRYLVDEERIERFTAEVRADGYELFRANLPVERLLDPLRTSGDVAVRTVVVGPGATFAGRTLGETRMRRDHGVTVTAIRRADGSYVYNPEADVRLDPGNALVLLGAAARIAELMPLLTGSGEPTSASAPQTGPT